METGSAFLGQLLAQGTQKSYLDMIRPYLRDLINHHKPTTKLNNDERRKWEIQLVMQNNFISTKDFKETRIIYSACKPAEVFMGSSNT